jgi:hypothetical protein
MIFLGCPAILSFSQGLLIIAITLVRQGLLAEDVEIAIAQQLGIKDQGPHLWQSKSFLPKCFKASRQIRIIYYGGSFTILVIPFHTRN